jgi:radical SAM superfamily enzyme YgiQ (UPF0313 family)
MKTVRIIVPAFPEINIFTRQAKKTTALGPVMLATAINKMPDFRAEVIDENNYRGGPRDSNGLSDHKALQKDNPAVIVGFYCGLTSTIERVWQLAELYKKMGVFTIAGGWHAHYCPEETLSHNIDVVIHGDAELVIDKVIDSLFGGTSLKTILGISFKANNEVKTNQPYMLENKNMDNLLCPDFGLLRFAKIKIYPISRIRGCSMNCEFCSVKGEPRCASAQYLFNTVKWLVETRKARHFFIVDDRLEQDVEGTRDFFERICKKYGSRLCFTVQIRLETAKNTPLLEIMKKAGVRRVCVGYESPIDEDLKAMRKGYLSSNMIEWSRTLRRYVLVHGMFIVGYPSKEQQGLITPKEIVKRYRKFIRKARIDTIQVLLPGPLVGTDLRERIKDRIFPLEIVPWRMYDGNYLCFKPDNMSPRELQLLGIELMSGFYRRLSLNLIKSGIRTIAFPINLFVRGWADCCRGWKKDLINYSAYRLVKAWLKKQENKKFIKRLEE